tara:strand:+ start:84 stop:1001 length:918 start_codon:yes stop_codon:yes gene_type:complete
MSKYKVAICLSGLVGSTSKGGGGQTIDFKLAKKFFDKNLINDYIDVSFFFHCWKNKYESKIIELYKPKNYVFEKPLKKESNITSREYGIISNNYSKLKVNELKKEYELENNLIFDYVILTRFDILILEKLDYQSLKRDKFYVVGPRIHHNKNCSCLFCNESDPNHCLNDLFFLSSSKSMDKFSRAYYYLTEYGFKSNHIITKKHLVKTDLYKNINFIFQLKANKYNTIWLHLEKIGIFPKGLVAVRIYDTNVPLIRWVNKPKFLKILDFIIFKFKIDLIYEYFIKVFKLKYYSLYFKKFLSSILK